MDRGLPILHLVRCRFGSRYPTNLEPPSYDTLAPAPHHLQAYSSPYATNQTELLTRPRDLQFCGHGGHNGSGNTNCCTKYVVLCFLCGGLSAAVGSLFLAVHAVLSAHTASLAFFETVPSYIPGTMLIFMGLFTVLLSRRKHRYGFLMKACASISVVCALVCVLVTVTTTVVHMSRLQGLRECVYTEKARTCTCYGAPQSRATDPGVLFQGTPHCQAVQGVLYACLRALFGVSVAGILACIFSCMLVYQLLTHERKKMYWEQLELRCRSLYGQGPSALVNTGSGTCGCCTDCGSIGGPWWAQSPGNLYTPNPDLAPSRRWRLPWSRSRGAAPAADTNYGFHRSQINRQSEDLLDTAVGPYSILNTQAAGGYSVLQAARDDHRYGQNPTSNPYSVLDSSVPLWGPPPPYSDPNSPARRAVLPYHGVDSRARLAKMMDNFQMREVNHSRLSDIKRPNDNYENTQQLSNGNDTDTSSNRENSRVSKFSKHKKYLKGVENEGFQPQEVNSLPKQSESELYFGDVSSCCGPESSFYEVSSEKEGRSNDFQQEDRRSYLIPGFNVCPLQLKCPENPQSLHSTVDITELPSHSNSLRNEGDQEDASNLYGNRTEAQYEVIDERPSCNCESENVSVISVYSESRELAKDDENSAANLLVNNDKVEEQKEEGEEAVGKLEDIEDSSSNFISVFETESMSPVNV